MKILTRYLLREMVVPFLIGQCAIVMLLTGSVLYNNADIFLQNQVPVVYVVKLALYFVPFLMHMTMPVAMAVAASLVVSRLGRDSEITVLRAAGLSLGRIFLPIFVTGLAVSVADFVFGEYVVPPTLQRFVSVISEIPLHLKRLTPPAGQKIVSSDQQYVLSVHSMIPRKGYIELNGVSIQADFNYAYATGEQPFVALAKTGRYVDGAWTLDNPTVFRFDINDPLKWGHATMKSFTYYIPVDTQAFQNGFVLNLPMGKMATGATKTFSQLGLELRRQRESGARVDAFAVLDYNFKLSIPFSCLVMALCCAPMALRFARGGGFMGTLLSICLVFVYWNTLLLARILGSPGPDAAPPLLPPILAAWSQNVLFVLLGVIVLRRSE